MSYKDITLMILLTAYSVGLVFAIQECSRELFEQKSLPARYLEYGIDLTTLA